MKIILNYSFLRESVETNDCSQFLDIWELTTANIPLPHFLDSLLFSLDGYQDDSRPICCVPEVRAFFSTFKNKWPLWFYGCNLSEQNLAVMVLSCLKSLRDVRFNKNTLNSVDFDHKEMRLFVGSELHKMEAVCRQAGMSAEAANHRRQRILEYFAPGITRTK